MLPRALRRAATVERLRHLARTRPARRGVVDRFVAGTLADVPAVCADLIGAGLSVTVDHLGGDTTDAAQGVAVRDAHLALLGVLAQAGLTAQGRAEISVKLSALGGPPGSDGGRMAREHAETICAAAQAAGTTVTLDLQHHAGVDETLSILRDLRVACPGVGVVLEAQLRRTLGDCVDLAVEGSRVRLCRGAPHQPASAAYQASVQVDRSYVRCMATLMAGRGQVSAATHDPRLIDITQALARRHRRPRGSYEFHLLRGVHPDEQRRLAAQGDTVRVCVPYGGQRYSYLIGRLAQRPADATLLLRSLISRG